MALSAEQKTDLELKIADGIVPPCPICGSSLSVSAEQVGKSGANGRNYSCSKDKLMPEQRSNCDLEPGIAYVNWKQNLRQSLRNRIVQLSLVGIGSISVVGFGGVKAGFIEIGNTKNDTTLRIDDSELHKKLASKEATILQLQQEIKKLQDAPAQPPVKQQLEEPKWKLGYALATDHTYSNYKRGKDWLVEGLNRNKISSDQDRKEVFKKLVEIQINRNSELSDWEFLKDQLLMDYSLPPAEKYFSLAEAYYNLQYKSPDSLKLKLDYTDTALCYYYCALSKMDTSNFQQVQALTDANALLMQWYGNATSFSAKDSIMQKLEQHNLSRNICN